LCNTLWLFIWRSHALCCIPLPSYMLTIDTSRPTFNANSQK
jgi:hypothetical protein